MKRFVFSSHVLEEMARRGISQEIVMAAVTDPEQIVPGRNQRRIYQSRFNFGAERLYLVRVIVDETLDPAVVITVYRTSKIDKYWRNP
jgi:hypothetical protein